MAQKSQWPEVNRITLDDLNDVIVAGINDFRRAPVFGLVFGGMYALGGLLLIWLLWVMGLPYLAYPLAMGFALIAPFAAGGFYAVSDILERGETPTWGSVLAGLKRGINRDLRWMALITGFALVLWMDIAAFLTFAFGGVNSFEPDSFNKLFTTPSGIAFLILGNIAGALIAFGVFSISVVSFPMLYDRDVDFVTAMVTSVRLVEKNPISMLAWCAFIGIAMGLSILSAFLGLIILLPIIGHATWHLYRRALAPAATETRAPAALPEPDTSADGLSSTRA